MLFNSRLLPILFLSIALGIVGIVVIYFFNPNNSLSSFNQQHAQQQQESPTLKDPDNNLDVELVTSNLSSPTSMSFIDNNNLLVLEKDGHVRLISNGILLKQPILTVSVNTTAERGLLGIATLSSGGDEKQIIKTAYMINHTCSIFLSSCFNKSYNVLTKVKE